MASNLTTCSIRAGLAACVLLLIVGPVSSARGLRDLPPSGCASTHPMIGLSGNLQTRSHDLAGTVTIVDDCTFKVENFSHDGTAPAVYWWGHTDASTLSTSSLSAGKRVVKEMVPFGDGWETYVGTLEDGITWDDIKVLYAWCEAFDINFGEVVFSSS